MKGKLSGKEFAKRVLLVTALVLFVVYFSDILEFVKEIYSIFFPIFLGCIIAYIVNIFMKTLEKYYFPKMRGKWKDKTKRPVCILMSYVIIFIILTLVINLIVPEVIDTLGTLSATLPIYLSNADSWFDDIQKQWPMIAGWLNDSGLNWEGMINSFMLYISQGIKGVISSSFSIISTLTTGLFNLFVALVFSVYLLMNKEVLAKQLSKMQRAFIKKDLAEKINRVLYVVNDTFSSFITGQCTEALILGILCVIFMGIFDFPYATSIGIFTGVTSMIPIFGAYLGAAVGLLLILAVDPWKALLFVLFIVILQQLEGNFIYPKVVGTSIGLPGIWVFAAVTIGGGIGGIGGMLLAVPIMATLYKLIRMATNDRLALKQK